MRRVGLCALLALLALGCGVSVAVESDSRARLRPPRSWSWLPRPAVPNGEVDLIRIDERVRSATTRALRARGFREAERGRPDFLVTYYAAVNGSIDARAVAYAAGQPSGTGGGYAQGSLVFDVLDADSGRLVWRGVGQDVFEPKQTLEERRKRIDDAVESIVGELASR